MIAQKIKSLVYKGWVSGISGGLDENSSKVLVMADNKEAVASWLKAANYGMDVNESLIRRATLTVTDEGGLLPISEYEVT